MARRSGQGEEAHGEPEVQPDPVEEEDEGRDDVDDGGVLLGASPTGEGSEWIATSKKS